MNNTFKLSLLSIALVGAAGAWAAAVDVVTANDNLQFDVTTASCPAIQEAIAIKQSKNVLATYDCGQTHVGIGTANSKGRGVTYRIHSGGGKPVEQTGEGTNGAAKKFATPAEAQTKANEKASLALTESASIT